MRKNIARLIDATSGAVLTRTALWSRLTARMNAEKVWRRGYLSLVDQWMLPYVSIEAALIPRGPTTVALHNLMRSSYEGHGSGRWTNGGNRYSEPAHQRILVSGRSHSDEKTFNRREKKNHFITTRTESGPDSNPSHLQKVHVFSKIQPSQKPRTILEDFWHGYTLKISMRSIKTTVVARNSKRQFIIERIKSNRRCFSSSHIWSSGSALSLNLDTLSTV